MRGQGRARGIEPRAGANAGARTLELGVQGQHVGMTRTSKVCIFRRRGHQDPTVEGRMERTKRKSWCPSRHLRPRGINRNKGNRVFGGVGGAREQQALSEQRSEPAQGSGGGREGTVPREGM